MAASKLQRKISGAGWLETEDHRAWMRSLPLKSGRGPHRYPSHKKHGIVVDGGGKVGCHRPVAEVKTSKTCGQVRKIGKSVGELVLWKGDQEGWRRVGAY